MSNTEDHDHDHADSTPLLRVRPDLGFTIVCVFAFTFKLFYEERSGRAGTAGPESWEGLEMRRCFISIVIMSLKRINNECRLATRTPYPFYILLHSPFSVPRWTLGSLLLVQYRRRSIAISASETLPERSYGQRLSGLSGMG